MDFLDLILPLVQDAAVLLLLAVVTYGMQKLRGYIELKQYGEHVILAKDMAATVVRALEQEGFYNPQDGQLKKEQAMLFLSMWFEERGIPITYEMLDRFIEEAVQIMNAELEQLRPAETEAILAAG